MKVRTVVYPALVLFALASACCQQAPPLVLSQTVSLPGVQGGFNHMSVDAVHLRLFAAAPTNKTLEIIDLREGKPWRSLEGERPAAVRYAPEFNQLYVSRGQSVLIYDGNTFDLITRIDLDSSLDELQYNAHARQLYVGCMTPGKTGIAVIDIPEGKLAGKIALPDKPQGIAVEQHGSRIYANMPTLKQIAVMDRMRRVLVETWPLADAAGNAPLGLDEARHRLFAGTRHPAQLMVLDTVTGKIVDKVDINGDADDLFYDTAHRRIYISCGEGFIDVIQQRDADHYSLIARIPTIAGARTSAFSVKLNSFFLGVPRQNDQPAELRIFKAKK